jgi:hypothetical protein
MEKLKNSLKSVSKLGLLGIMLAGLLVFTQSAFKGKEKLVQTWSFNHAVDNDMLNANNYQLNGTPSEECDLTSPLPCQIVVDDNITTPSQLATFLSTKTESQILDDYADGRVPRID